MKSLIVNTQTAADYNLMLVCNQHVQDYKWHLCVFIWSSMSHPSLSLSLSLSLSPCLSVSPSLSRLSTPPPSSLNRSYLVHSHRTKINSIYSDIKGCPPMLTPVDTIIAICRPCRQTEVQLPPSLSRDIQTPYCACSTQSRVTLKCTVWQDTYRHICGI